MSATKKLNLVRQGRPLAQRMRLCILATETDTVAAMMTLDNNGFSRHRIPLMNL